jgi:hypothetical protein
MISLNKKKLGVCATVADALRQARKKNYLEHHIFLWTFIDRIYMLNVLHSLIITNDYMTVHIHLHESISS